MLTAAVGALEADKLGDHLPIDRMVKRCAVPIYRLGEARRLRYLNEVVCGRVMGLVAANANVGAGVADQFLDLRQDHVGRQGRALDRRLGRQALALLDVEDREPLQEGKRVRLVAVLARPPALVVGHEAVGVDDSRTGFTLADVTDKAHRLAEGAPCLTYKSAVGNRGP